MRMATDIGPRWPAVAKVWAAFCALPHTAAYRIMRRIALGLLTVRVALLVALLCLLIFDAAINRAHAETVQEARQASLDDMLRIDAAATIADFRASCAAGKSAALISRGVAMGVTSLPNAVDLCVTALIRTGRDGVLRPLRSSDGRVMPSLALDTGFVAGFSKGGSVGSLP